MHLFTVFWIKCSKPVSIAQDDMKALPGGRWLTEKGLVNVKCGQAEPAHIFVDLPVWQGYNKTELLF
jgi:hypothetical protein